MLLGVGAGEVTRWGLRWEARLGPALVELWLRDTVGCGQREGHGLLCPGAAGLPLAQTHVLCCMSQQWCVCPVVRTG